MGEPISRLNPKVESSVQRVLLNQSVQLLLSIAMMLPFQEQLSSLQSVKIWMMTLRL